MIAAAWLAAAVLAIAGAAKVLDPTMTAGALRAMGLPGSPGLVRVGAVAELALAVLAIVVGGSILWGLVAISYAAFAVFVAAALVTGRPMGTCGCFGRADIPPTWWHVVGDVALGAGAAWFAVA